MEGWWQSSLIFYVSSCCLFLFCFFERERKNKEKRKNNSNALAEDGLEIILSSKKKRTRLFAKRWFQWKIKKNSESFEIHLQHTMTKDLFIVIGFEEQKHTQVG